MCDKKNNIFFITVIIIYILFFICYLFISPEKTKLDIDNIKSYENGWTVNNIDIDNFPQKINVKKNETIILENILPLDIENNYILSYASNYLIQKVYIDNKLVYSYGDKQQLPFGNLSGNIKCLVPLDKDCAGKNIKIEMTSYYSQIVELQAFEYGDAGYINLSILLKNLWRIPFVIILFLISIIAFITSLYSKTDGIKFNKQLLLYYAVFTLCIISWLICSSDLPQFFTNNNAIVSLNSFINILLAACSYSGFCKNIFENNKLFNIIEKAGIVLVIINIVLFILNIKDPIDLLIYTHIYILIVLLSNIYLSTKEIKINKSAKPSLISTSLFSILMIISLISFYRHPGNGRDGLVVAFAFTFLSMSLFYITLSNKIDMIKELTSDKIYKIMAYQDQMTKLNNRAALEEDMNNFDNTLKNNDDVIFIMCDLNYLKQTNDNIGHDAGDQLIKNAAKCLKDTFSDIGKCYRLGGDEFAIIIINSPIQPNILLEKLKENINTFNENLDIKISIAYGYSNKKFDLNNKDFKTQIYKEADNKMYEMKSKQHKSR